MSHLAEEYAKSCGVKIGSPVLNPHYFPILHDKYITIHNDKKVQAKKYDMWPDVIQILKPYLKDIKIIQIGSHGEEKIEGVHQHLPTTTLKQCAYIINNALSHVGIDSVPVHMASALDKPVVGIYAHTYANTCRPLWNKKTKSIKFHDTIFLCKKFFICIILFLIFFFWLIMLIPVIYQEVVHKQFQI